MVVSFITLIINNYHSTVPSSPIDFGIIMKNHGNMETEVTLDWDSPQGTGPEAIVDNYTISISPTPLFQQEVLIQMFNVTLAHNVLYTINLTAMNCAGVSEPAILSNIGFSELSSLSRLIPMSIHNNP